MDLHAPEGTTVLSMEEGTVVAIQEFTGPDAGSPWWLPTKAIMVEGPSGVILYGEVHPLVEVGSKVEVGTIVGTIARVLRRDKGRPVSMLHMELYVHGTRVCCELWKHGEPIPEGLLDPMPLIKRARE